LGTDPTHAHRATASASTVPPASASELGDLQNRYPYEVASWPGIATSTAFNADLAYGIWRGCFEGYETWLNTVDRGATYAAGDEWGCVGRWFAAAGTPRADQYISTCKGISRAHLDDGNFQEP